jgi:putative DNA primase/helicase
LIPFNVTIPEDERDKDLPVSLEAEWPAIFRWMVNGCAAWMKEGLNPPKAVRIGVFSHA